MSSVVCHICLNGPYTDGWNYQENVLPKYHVKMGYRVFQIVTPYAFVNGTVEDIGAQRYINQDQVEIIRIKPVYHKLLGQRANRYPNIASLLEELHPDILFIHDVQFLDTDKIAAYLKAHPNCTAYADNHADFANSASNIFSKIILHQMIWRNRAQKLVPYVKKFYGVLPARVDFLTDVYQIPKSKCELLVMGADDELVYEATTSEKRRFIREKYHVSPDDFLIVTGGKINQYRPETLNLMEAVLAMHDPHVKLLLFGSVSDELKPQFDLLARSPNIIFAGWQDAQGTYDLMAAGNLIVFPGLHSVMWEQAAALGVPCIFRDLKGFHHIDLGGNALLLEDVSSMSLQSAIESLVHDPVKYQAMKRCAQEKGMNVFSYKNIAKRSIES